MIRIAMLSFLAACASLAPGAMTHAHAASGAQGYVATPATVPAKTSFIVREKLWRCDSTGACRGPASTSAPATACVLAAKEIGALTRFEAGGRAFDEAALARCNGRAD